MPPTSDPAATFLARLRQRSTQGARPEGRWPCPTVRVGGQGRGRERGALLPLFHSTTPPPLLTPLLPFSAVATTRTQIPPSLITPAEALGPDLQAGVILGFVGPQGAGGNPGAGLLADLAGHEDAWPFGAPVDARDVPDYYTVVKDPMDFATLKERVAAFDAHYAAVDGFVADVRRVFANARLYNAADTVYAKCATRMEAALDGLLASRVTFGTG